MSWKGGFQSSGGGGGAAALTQLSKSVATGNVTSFDTPSIPGSGSSLEIHYLLQTDDGSNASVQFNGDSGANYDFVNASGSGSNSFASTIISANTIGFFITTGSGAYGASGKILIPGYATTTLRKSALVQSGIPASTTQIISGGWRSTVAINRVTLLSAAGHHFTAGSFVAVYLIT